MPLTRLPVYTAPMTDDSGDVAFFDHAKSAVLIVSAFKGTRQLIFKATGLVFKGTTIDREINVDMDAIRTKAQMTAFAKQWVRDNSQNVVVQGHTPA